MQPFNERGTLPWHAAALAAFAAAAVLTMRPWLHPRVLPAADFPGFAAEVDWTRAALAGDGGLPTWVPERFAGSTRFMSNAKEVLTYPLARRFGAVQGTKLAFLLARVVAAFGLYLVCVAFLRSPAAGLVAGGAYGFGAPANVQSTLGGHLDLAFSAALLPYIVLAAAALLRRRRAPAAGALGALGALEFLVHSYLQAMIVPVVFGLLLLLRPWRREAGEDRLGDPALTRRWAALSAAALGVFLLLGASQAAWLAADLRHHALHSPASVAHGLERFVELSPFLYVNRGDWLGAWLREHAPPGLLLAAADPGFNQRRYLGVVALALCVAGWFLARRDFGLRRWFQAFLLLFAVQYWLSVGPRTVVWQVARTFHWPAAVDAPLRAALTAGALGCLAWAAALWRRRRARPAAAPFARIELALGLALLQLLVAHPLFTAARAVLPVLRGMRSPGHFFDLAPFAFYAMMGVAVAAALRRVRPAARGALVAGIAAALAVDFRPTLADFRRRLDGAAVAAMRSAVHALPGEGGTLRIAAFPEFSPAASLVTAVADAGSASSWLHWQALAPWPAYLRQATAWLADDFRDARSRALARRTGEALLAVGRVRWVLEDVSASAPPLRLEPPWTRLGGNGAFVLWHGPPVLPMGTVFRDFALLVGGDPRAHAAALADALAAGVVTVAGGERLADVPEELLAAAAVVRHAGPAPLADDASRARAARHAARLLDAHDAHAVPRWAGLLAERRPVAEARYARPAAERMRFEIDAGAAPAVLFVSEAHHPWWRARVDGAPADVLRAQMAFMAVRVPPGRHAVELELRPPLAVRAADGVTAAAWVGLGAWVVAAAAWTAARRARGGAA